ncbi:ATP-binding protein [Shewanella abyssi]|uniref:ATP-binding protein n=1 Tax=Shewanella abyssi TaxID=311789 RepID=UPI00200D5456|nr:ATP-binding protein [Shewanella abyssi]MCL1051833.1 ATP-binding protein [Shewanella abyssi]
MINDNVIPYRKEADERFSSHQLTPNIERPSAPSNAALLDAYATWCEAVIQTRLQLHFAQECPFTDVYQVTPPDIASYSGTLAVWVQQHDLDFSCQLLLALALMPIVKPQVLDVLLMRNDNIERPYSEFGGGEYQGAVVANGDTLTFLLGGESIEIRLQVQRLLSAMQSGNISVLTPGEAAVMQLLDEPEPATSNPFKRQLILAAEPMTLLTISGAYHAAKGANFPAQLVTSHSLDSLVLADSVMRQLDDIHAWSQHGETLRNSWGMADRIRPGYRALFHGPSGTGKTMTAGVLGQRLGKDVYKVDLSRVHSKYIGETEKNLERVFTLAEKNQWILFFDEADAVFGKRTQTSSANDQFANQNISYLLQRIERFEGLVILASNYKDNVDEAFFRRFESVIHFPKPAAEQRLAIWRNGFSPQTQLAQDVDLQDLALRCSLSGASIMNVIRYVSLKAIAEGRTLIGLGDLQQGIDREQGSSTQPRW